MYPHPADCSQFIGCRSEELTIFQCPTPLLFDPIQKSCQPPEEVECRTSCIDRPNGEYPHPHDCSLFIICRDGDANLYKCPPPLLFDPILSACNFPDDVDCYSVKHIFDRNQFYELNKYIKFLKNVQKTYSYVTQLSKKYENKR